MLFVVGYLGLHSVRIQQVSIHAHPALQTPCVDDAAPTCQACSAPSSHTHAAETMMGMWDVPLLLAGVQGVAPAVCRHHLQPPVHLWATPHLPQLPQGRAGSSAAVCATAVRNPGGRRHVGTCNATCGLTWRDARVQAVAGGKEEERLSRMQARDKLYAGTWHDDPVSTPPMVTNWHRACWALCVLSVCSARATLFTWED